MDPNLAKKLEKANYRKVTESILNCTNCTYSDSNLDITDEGIVISHCYIFHMKVDEFHICDLIG